MVDRAVGLPAARRGRPTASAVRRKGTVGQVARVARVGRRAVPAAAAMADVPQARVAHQVSFLRTR
eukprot:3477663-Prymnesium_polylepis.1